jgi:hypothetical protein
MNRTRERNFHSNTILYALEFIKTSNAKFKNDIELKNIIDKNIQKITNINKFFINLLKYEDPNDQLSFVMDNITDYNKLKLTDIDAYHIDIHLYKLLIKYFNIFQSKLIKIYEDLDITYKNINIDDLIKEFNYYNQYMYEKYSRYIMRIRELYKCLLLLKNMENLNTIYNIIKLIKEFFDKIKGNKVAMEITESFLKDIYIKNEENITEKYKSRLKYVTYEDFIKNIDIILFNINSPKPKPKPQEEEEVKLEEIVLDLKKSKSKSKSKSNSK